MKRREFLVAGAVAPLLVAGACSANAATILNDIDNVLGDAEAVVAAVEATGTVSATVFAGVNAWLGLVKTATDQALVIDGGAVKLTAVQITQIVSLYSQAIVFNIPGVPVVIESAITAAIAGIKVLLNLLQPKTAGFASANGIVVELSPGGRVKHFFVKRHANAFGSHITKMHVKMVGRLTASTPNFGTKGFGS